MSGPQNKDAVNTMLRALDSNLGRYRTDEEQDRFFDRLAGEHKLAWVGHGKKSAEYHDGGSLRRCLRRLLQDRLDKFKRELSSDESMQAIFEHGSAMIDPARLSAYDYVPPSTEMEARVNGKRKRTETEAGKEFRSSLKASQRRSHVDSLSEQKERNSGSVVIDQSAARQTRRQSNVEAKASVEFNHARSARRSRQMSAVEDTGLVFTEDGSHENKESANPEEPSLRSADEDDFTDSGQFRQTKNADSGAMHRLVTNSGSQVPSAKVNHGEVEHESEVLPTPDVSHRGSAPNLDRGSIANVDEDTRTSNAKASESSSAEADIEAQFHELAGLISALTAKLLRPGSYPAVLPSRATRDLESLYICSMGSDWEVATGTLLKDKCLDAANFAQNLIWSWLHTHMLNRSHEETPLWHILDRRSLSHACLRREIIQQATSAAVEDTDSAFLALQCHIRNAARHQLRTPAFDRSVIQPKAWSSSLALRALVEEHVAFSNNRLPLSDEEKAEVAIAFKNICQATFLLDAHLRICADSHEWSWPRGAKATEEQDGTPGLTIRPGLSWLPAQDNSCGPRELVRIMPCIDYGPERAWGAAASHGEE